MSMTSIFKIVLISLVINGEHVFAKNATDVWWYHITRVRSPSEPAGAPCFLRGPTVSKRNDYTYLPGVGAYKFHKQSANWYTALLTCRTEGAHLAIINSAAESQAIATVFAQGGSHIGSYGPDYCWLGFHDLYGSQGVYETIDGQYLANAGFDEWQDVAEKGFCGAMHKDGKLSFFGCHRVLAFVCEMRDIPVA